MHTCMSIKIFWWRYRHIFIFFSDIDECRANTHNCSAHAQCYNSLGAYSCECLPGYFGNGRSCATQEECSRTCGRNMVCEPCNNSAGCTDTAQSYRCACGDGYRENTCRGSDCGGNALICADVNECEEDGICDRNLTCVNSVGSYSCDCRRGFTMVGQFCEGTWVQATWKSFALRGTSHQSNSDDYKVFLEREVYIRHSPGQKENESIWKTINMSDIVELLLTHRPMQLLPF